MEGNTLSGVSVRYILYVNFISSLVYALQKIVKLDRDTKMDWVASANGAQYSALHAADEYFDKVFS